MKNIMLDLETLSTEPDAAIVAIGAVTFSDDPMRDSGIERRQFYAAIDGANAQALGGHVDAKTVAWWAAQPDEARKVLFDAGAKPLFNVLQAFGIFCAEFGDVSVWGNGADFDNVVLRRAYDRVGMSAPWSFRANRCYRTLRSLAPAIEFESIGVKHNAKDDALSQAVHAERIFSFLRKGASQ